MKKNEIFEHKINLTLNKVEFDTLRELFYRFNGSCAYIESDFAALIQRFLNDK